MESTDSLPIEDTFADIISKAQAGHHISLTELSERSGVSTQQIQALKSGVLDEQVLVAVAPHLHLHTSSLLKIAANQYAPNARAARNVRRFATPFAMATGERLTVNAYLYFDRHSKDAIVVDTGTDAEKLFAFIRSEALNVRGILLTHTHLDHISVLESLRELDTHPNVYVSAQEPVEGAEWFTPEATLHLGSLVVVARETSGHTAGGSSFILKEGGAEPVAFVGDALFAGSVGGAPGRMSGALHLIRQHILSLPADTLVCPGHGPLTTVGYERSHNPFLASH